MTQGLWDWAVAAYGREGVAEACLDLQDQHGQSVPLLLWAAWSEPAGAEAIEAACETARAWHEAAIDPLRAVRRRLALPHVDLTPEARLAVREPVKAAELAAERALLEALERLGRPGGRAAIEPLAAVARGWGRVVPRPALERLVQRLSA